MGCGEAGRGTARSSVLQSAVRGTEPTPVGVWRLLHLL